MFENAAEPFLTMGCPYFPTKGLHFMRKFRGVLMGLEATLKGRISNILI